MGLYRRAVPQMGELYDELYREVVEDLAPMFKRAKEQGDPRGVRAVKSRLRRLMAGVYGTFRKTFMAPQVGP
jgi:hypothetical protein